MKNNGDNLILGCEEAPLWSIGDECALDNGMNAEVIGIYESMAWLKIKGEARTVPVSHISKPKTPEDIIKQNLADYIADCLAERIPSSLIADAILENFNVTEK